MEVTAEPTLIRHFKGHKGRVTQLSFHPSANQIATSSLDSTVMLWNFNQAARCVKFTGHLGPVHSVSWSPKADLVASASKDRTVRVWVPKIRGATGEFLAHTAAVRTVDFNPDGRQVNIVFHILVLESQADNAWPLFTGRPHRDRRHNRYGCYFPTSFISHKQHPDASLIYLKKSVTFPDNHGVR